MIRQHRQGERFSQRRRPPGTKKTAAARPALFQELRPV